MTVAPPRGPNPAAARRFPVVLTLVAAVAFAILCGLGAWQVQRLQWKEAVIARIAAGQARPPEPLADALARAARGEDIDFTRVSVDCLEPDFPPSRVILLSLKEGQSVWRPIAPCRVTAGGYSVIAVDRGVAQTDSVRAPRLDLPAPRRVTGVLRRPEKLGGVQAMVTYAENDDIGYQHRVSALAAIVRNAGVRSPDLMIVAESEAPAPPGVTPSPLPVNISNRHLGYVITWFGLAAALAAVYAAMLMRRLRP